MSKTIKHLSKRELTKLFRIIANHDGRHALRDLAAFHIAYYCGLRGSELELLQARHYDRHSRELYVSRRKGSRSGMILLDPERVRILNRYLREFPAERADTPLFRSQKGGAIKYATLKQAMYKYADMANLPEDKRHFHVLKHSIAVHLLDAGVGIYEVKEHLGHCSVRSTETYLSLTTAHRKEYYAQIHKPGVLAN